MRFGLATFALAFALPTILADVCRADVRLPRLVSDGMVLQRERRVAVFGFADPGERVDVSASWGATADQAVTDGDGRWTTSIVTPAAGGPHTLTIRGQNEIVVRDVLVGEVWLGSGQSNMEMPLAPVNQGYTGVSDWQREVAAADHPRIRLFTVENRLAYAPEDDCRGRWVACTPESAASFSASLYFFGRALERELDVPVGLVAADWGGTPAESWVSAPGLREFPEFRARLVESSRAALDPGWAAKARDVARAAWRDRLDEVEPGLRLGHARPDFDDSTWEAIEVPAAWSGALSGHDGTAWMRKAIEIPAAQAGRALILELGPIDDQDATYFDGVLVGEHQGESAASTPRAYRVDARLVTAGRHVIAVRVLDTGGVGGIGGAPGAARLRAEDGSAAWPLAGAWRITRGLALARLPRLRLPAELDSWTPSALFNGMIAPVARFGIRGVVWYQGESNRERAHQYKTLFPALIADWRARFRQGDFPFGFVQIAPFGYRGDRGETGELREAQRQALAVPNTGMVVTTDIGDERDIHPKNKQEVGRRLALWALATTYGRDVEWSGPMLRAARPHGAELELEFDHGEGLRFRSGAPAELLAAGDDEVFRPTAARVEGPLIRVPGSNGRPPRAVRYAVGPADTGTIENAAGLPASPFRSDTLPWVTANSVRGDRQRWNRSGDLLSLAAPIQSADEGVPLGNGLLGALVWGEGSTLRLSLDRGDLWDLRRPEVTRRADWTWRTLQRLVEARDEARIHELFDTPYDAIDHPTKLPVGRVEFDLDPRSPLRAFDLDLARGEAHATGQGSRATLVVAEGEPLLMLRFETEIAPRARLVPPAIEGYPLRVTSRSTESDAEQQVVVEAPGSVAYAITVASASQGGVTEIAVTVTTNRESSDPGALGKERARAALAAGFAARQAPTQAWWLAFHATSRIEIEDRALQDHYDFARYLHGAGSRRGAPPMPLQGVWTRDGGLPPWKGDYHNDLNTETTYIAYPTAGLFDCGGAFLDFQWDLLPRFREFARDFYGVSGAVVPGVMALDGAPLGGWAQYSLSPTNGAWIAEIFARHARFTRDAEFLRDRAWPWCREIGDALASLLVTDERGRSRLPLSSSPEIHDASLRAWLAPNSNYDLALLGSLFSNLVSMARELGHPDDAERFERARAGIEPFDVDARGALTFARGEPYAESHRHFSHAVAIHPLGSISIEGSPAERRVVDATVDGILEHGTRNWCGYSFAWFACMLARAGRPESALAFLQDYERAFTLRNGFHCNGDQSGEGLSALTYRPFTLEGNMLAMEAVHEMLLQSWGGVVRVFPATSRAWRDASFTDLWAEGGFLVGATRKEGRTTLVEIRATRGGELRLRDPFGDRPVNWNRDVRRVGADWVVTLPVGEVLRGADGPLPPRAQKRETRPRR